MYQYDTLVDPRTAPRLIGVSERRYCLALLIGLSVQQVDLQQPSLHMEKCIRDFVDLNASLGRELHLG